MRKIVIGILGLVVLVVLFFVLCTFTQRPYEVVILDRAGRVVEHPTSLGYNLYLCLPTDHVVRIDTRLHLFQGQVTQINTKDNEPILVRIFAAWHVDRDNAARYYSHLSASDDRARTFIGQKIPGVAGAVVGQHTMDELFNVDVNAVKMGQIEQDIINTANLTGGASEGLAAQGIKIDQVGFSRFAFSPSNAQAVYNRMASERYVRATAFSTEGESEKARLISEGAQEAQQTRSAAEAEAQKIRGEGAAEAIEILSEAQSDPATREFYRYWKNMELLAKAMTSKVYLIMTPDDPLFAPIYKFVKDGGGTTQPATMPSGVAPGAVDSSPVQLNVHSN